MLGLGWTEMLVVGIAALIVIGPKDLPVLMGRLGKMVATVRRMGSEFQREINRSTGLEQITDLRKSITDPLKKTADDLRKEFNKPLASGGYEPSGAIKPAVAGSESVVKEIHEKVGMTPPAMTPLTTPAVPAPAPVAPAIAAEPKPVESPAPVEAIAPVATPARKPRAKKAVPKPVAPAPLLDTVPAPAKKAAAKKAAPRRKPAPKAES